MHLKGTRETQETSVTVDLTQDGSDPQVELSWEHHGGIDEAIDQGMAKHLYTTLLRYARLGGTLSCQGDLAHHVIEDTAILLGQQLGQAAADETIVRFADRTVAMDDALVQVVLDAGDRPFYASDLDELSPLWDHVLRTIAFEARFTLHVEARRGHDAHHVIEAALKALGMGLHDALAPSDRLESTKGRVERSD